MKFALKHLALPLACLLATPGLAHAESLDGADTPAAESDSYNPDIDMAFAREYYEQMGQAAEPEKPVVRQLRSKLKAVEASETVDLVVNQGRLLQLPREASNVMVANPNLASFQVASPGSVFVFSKIPGTTTLYALDANDEVVAAVRLVSRQNTEALMRLSQQIADEIPGAKVEFVPSGTSLIVRGSVRTPQQAKQVMDSVEANLGARPSQGGGAQQQAQAPGANGQTVPRVINQLKVELSAQVNISVRIVEVSRSLTTSLGMNWQAAFTSGRGSVSFNSNLFDATINRSLLSATQTRGRFQITTLLSALSEDGMATILAEPNLTAMSGETAGFAAGGEVPIVTFVNNSVNIDFKQYGVIMRMTPTLLSPNRISLHVAPEVSDLSDEGAVQLDGFTIPAFKVRRADTTIELASGQSFALAGMLRSSINQQVRSVPGLKSVPVLGRFFEDETSEQSDNELVIIATAYVVEPTTAGALQTPGRGIRALDNMIPAQATAGYLF